MDPGERIATARKYAGLTQRQVADALSVSVQAVSLWETSRAFPPSERLRRLATVLGVSSAWLAGEEERAAPLQPAWAVQSQAAHIIPIGELIYFFTLKPDERSCRYKEIVATRPGRGDLFAVQATADLLVTQRFTMNPGERELAGDDGYSGTILIFDMGLIPEAGDYAVVTIVDRALTLSDPDMDGAPVAPIHMSLAVRKLLPRREGEATEAEREALRDDKMGGWLSGVSMSDVSILGVLVEERRLLRTLEDRHKVGHIRGQALHAVDRGLKADPHKCIREGDDRAPRVGQACLVNEDRLREGMERRGRQAVRGRSGSQTKGYARPGSGDA